MAEDALQLYTYGNSVRQRVKVYTRQMTHTNPPQQRIIVCIGLSWSAVQKKCTKCAGEETVKQIVRPSVPINQQCTPHSNFRSWVVITYCCLYSFRSV